MIFVFKVVWGHEHECRLTPEHKDLGEGKEIFIRYYSYITLALGGRVVKNCNFCLFSVQKMLTYVGGEGVKKSENVLT